MNNIHLVKGLHHVTAISGPAQENLDFYAGVLGMRLVKKSVNQDDPATYHLFYADAEGHPGSDLTFFPWAQMAPSRDGYGLSNEVSLAIPPGSLVFWGKRLKHYGAQISKVEVRFGEKTLPFQDPHGLHLALVESKTAEQRPFTPWEGGPVAAAHQIRGLESARMTERDLKMTVTFLTDAMGFKHLGTEKAWHRYGVGEGKSGAYVDVREVPTAQRGRWGRGSVHHLAWRVEDEWQQADLRTRVVEAGAKATRMINRFWFKSVYFPEPGGVLFELATDGPGFAVDEDPARLGESLMLPPWLEVNRAAIEAALPKLTTPAAQSAAPA